MDVRSRRYHPTFVADLSAAVSYYDTISPDLGNRFRDSVRHKLGLISESPEVYAKIHNAVRAARTNRFPYVLLFQVHDEVVAILGIKHAASDRGTWFPGD